MDSSLNYRDRLFRPAQMHKRIAKLEERSSVIWVKCNSRLPLADRFLQTILQSATEPHHHRACPSIVRILLDSLEEQPFSLQPAAEGDGSQTLCWREMDSNFRFRARGAIAI